MTEIRWCAIIKQLVADPRWWQSEFLNFYDTGVLSEGAKTHKYEVKSRLNGTLLGYVKWLNQWRRYCFYPIDAVFEETCLRDIAEFIEQRTMIHKVNKRWKKIN